MNVPKLRFKEFNDESYRKDILKNIISYIADNRGKNPDYYLDSGIPVIDNFMIQNQGYPDLSRANRYIDDNIYENFIRKAIEYNDTLITLVGNGIGNICLTPKEKCVIIQNTLGLRTNKFNDKKYLYHLLTYKNSEIKKLDRGMAQPSIRQDELLKLEVTIPNINEQLKISNFLSLLDKKIELQSKKIEDLKLFKLYIRNKIFSGIKTKDKIINTLNYEQPNRYIVKSDDYLNDENLIPVLTANKAFILGYCNEDDYYNKGDVIIFDDFTMDSKYVNFNFKIKSSAIKLLTQKNNNNLKYIFECLQALNLESTEHKRHYISIVQEIEIPVPDIIVQNKIANLMFMYDKKIKLESDNYNKLIELKKGLMQNMFV